MRVFREIENYPAGKQPLFLALGNFDGVHLGHQKILSRVCEDARKQGGLAAVMTFSEHPQKILHTGAGPHLLYSLEQKLFFLEKAGVDVCFLLPFTESFSKLEAKDFAAKILAEALQVRKIYLGHNARFGHDRKGDSALMQQLAAKLGFDFETVSPVNIEGEPVSSSRVRAFVEAGDFKNAAACLGRPFSMFLKVISGDRRGKELGFPTANFDMEGRVHPPLGVYPVKLRLIPGDTWRQAVANCGHRPTFQPASQKVVLEAFILDFPEEDLYGRTFEVLFYPRLRPEKIFSDAGLLKSQIQKDIQSARTQFGTSSGV